MRAAAGRREPWTEAFRTIHIELGNETWNGDFRGESIEDPVAYGRRANAVFAAFRARRGRLPVNSISWWARMPMIRDATPRCWPPRRWPIRWPLRRT